MMSFKDYNNIIIATIAVNNFLAKLLHYDILYWALLYTNLAVHDRYL